MNLSLVSERLRSGLKNALQLVSQVLRGIEADAARKADPTRRTSMDNLFAVLAFLTATTLVFACIAVGRVHYNCSNKYVRTVVLRYLEGEFLPEYRVGKTSFSRDPSCLCSVFTQQHHGWASTRTYPSSRSCGIVSCVMSKYASLVALENVVSCQS